MNGRLLVISGDESVSGLVREMLAPGSADVTVARDGPAGVGRALADHPEAILLDTSLAGLDTPTVLEGLKAADPSLAVIAVIDPANGTSAAKAIQAGAALTLVKPIDREALAAVLRRALESRAMALEVADLRRRVEHDEADRLAAVMGTSPDVRRIVEQVRAAARSTLMVLIRGEAGTGKELVALAIHRQSDRRLTPFIALDCAAMSDALLEIDVFGATPLGGERSRIGRAGPVDGGTVFLDEIANLPPNLQLKLLRLLESRRPPAAGAPRPPVPDFRFIASTSQDLQARVAQGLFRGDLYDRLAPSTIVVPPLRDRAADIGFLTQRFLEDARIEFRRPVQDVAPAGLERLRRHRWPGNVRELRTAVRQAVQRTRGLVVQDDALAAALEGRDVAAPVLALAPSGELSLRETADQAARAAERLAIVQALQATMGNKSRAAKALRTDYKTLHVKMKALKINARDFKPG